MCSISLKSSYPHICILPNTKDAKEVVIIITGVSKAIALQQIVEGAMSHQWTASAIQIHPNATIVTDEDATNELKVFTPFVLSALQPVIPFTFPLR